MKNNVPEKYESKTPGDYMMVNAHGVLFIVRRKGRNKNIYGTQLCMTNNEVTAWSEYMRFLGRKYPVKISKETDLNIYNLWYDWMKEMHVNYYVAQTTIL